MLHHLITLGMCCNPCCWRAVIGWIGVVWYTACCHSGSILIGGLWFKFICRMISLATSCTIGTQCVVFIGWVCCAITLNLELLSLPKSPNLVGLPSLNSSTLSSNSTASLMHALSVLCFLGYRATWSLQFNNHSKKSDTSHSWLGISISRHLRMYFFNLFEQSLTVSISNCLKL